MKTLKINDNRIKTITLPDNSVITYTYHADGTRATKTTPTEYIEFHYSGSLIKEVHMNPSNHSQIYFTLHFQSSRMIYDPNSPGGGDEVKYYTVTDTQGTVYKLTDYQGTTVASYTYDPFGNRLTNSAPTIYNPIGFAGTYYDYESGLYFAQSRYLDPTTSRFTTKDSYRGDLGSHISQNRYIYCAQNPISFTDPSGFAPSRENDGTKNLLIRNNEDTDSSSSTTTTNIKTTTNSHTSAPKGNAIQTSPDDVVFNPDCYGNDLMPPKKTNSKSDPGDTEIGPAAPKPGEIVEIPPGSGSYLANIGGHFIVITFKNGEVTFTPKDKSDKEAQDICDAFTESMPPQLVRDIFGSKEGIKSFVSSMQDYYNNNWSQFKSMYPNDANFKRFFFCAALGYGVAKWISEGYGGSTEYSKRIFDLFVKLAKATGGKFTKDDFSKILMHIGFWTTFYNSDYDEASDIVTFNLEFEGQAKNWSDTISFAELVNMHLIFYYQARFCSLNDKLNEDQRKELRNMVASLMDWTVAQGTSYLPKAATGLAGSFATGLALLFIGLIGIADSVQKNWNLITGGNAYRCKVACQENFGLSIYNLIQTTNRFSSFGLTIGYFEACLKNVKTALFDGQSRNTQIGDTCIAFALQTMYYKKTDGAALFSLHDTIIKFCKVNKNLTITGFSDWKFMRYDDDKLTDINQP